MTETSWAPTGKPTEASELRLIEARERLEPWRTEQHSPSVLDNHHPGVKAALEDNPKGWQITLQHVLDKALEFANSGYGVATIGEWAYRGENREFPTMRTSLERWAHCRTVVNPPRPLEAQDLVLWQIGLTKVLFDRGFGPEMAEARLRQELLGLLRNRPAMPLDPEIRLKMFQLQHHGGPTLWLDWTWDVRAALYFACCGAPDCNGRVWFMKVKTLSYPTSGIFELVKLCNHHWVKPDQHDPSDRRLQAQSSLFLFLDQGGVVWREEHQGNVLGVTIPKSHKKRILEELCREGTNHANLFPPMSSDLSGAVSVLLGSDVGFCVSSSE